MSAWGIGERRSDDNKGSERKREQGEEEPLSVWGNEGTSASRSVVEVFVIPVLLAIWL